MKILVVSNMYPSSKYPTAGIFVYKFCKMLDDIGISYDLSAMTWTTNKLRKIAKYLIFYITTFLKCVIGKYDCIYIHYASHSSAPVLLARKYRKIKIIANVHGSDVIPENNSQERFQKYTCRAMRISEKIVVPSEYFRDVVVKKYSVDPGKVYVFPSSGVDAMIFHEYDDTSIARLRYEFDLKENKKTFLFAGRITPGKGWDTFIKAIEILNNKHIGANYIIVGSGNKENELDKMITELHLENEIIRRPLMNQLELAKIYSISDAFIFPTEREGESLGLVALEAMACGTPVIASDFAAPKYYVEEGVNGYKFEMGDYKQLASIIKSFVDSKVPIKILREGALKTANLYSSSKLKKQLKEILQQ